MKIVLELTEAELDRLQTEVFARHAAGTLYSGDAREMIDRIAVTVMKAGVAQLGRPSPGKKHGPPSH